MSITFDALVSSDSLIIRPRDSAADPGEYLLVSSVQSGNDQQQVRLFGPLTSGNLTLTFNGQTTAPIAYTAIPPAAYATFQSLTVVAGASTDIAMAALPSPGFYTRRLTAELIDGGVVVLSVVLDLGGVTSGTFDFTQSNPLGGAPIGFVYLFRSYVPTSTSLSVRFSGDGNDGLFWDIDALDVAQVGHGHTTYDDADGTHFTSAGQQGSEAPGSDGRFWAGGFTRFNGGTQAGMLYTIDPADMRAKLEALSSIGAGQVTVTAGAGNHTPLTCEFVDTLGAEAQPGMTSTAGVLLAHTVGGVVPSVVETLHDGTVLAAVSIKGQWIYQAGRTSGALYWLNGLITPSATSTYQVIIPSGSVPWMTSVAGDVAPATVSAENRVGGHILPPFAETPKTMGAAYNVLSDLYYTEAAQHADFAARCSTLPLGSVAFGGNLALDANLYPTLISPNGSQFPANQPTQYSRLNNPLGNLNAPNGIWTWVCTDPGHAWVTPGGGAGTTSCSTVSGMPDTTTGDVKVMYRNLQADTSQQRTPTVVTNWNASGADVPYGDLTASPCTVTNLQIFPPDPSDPTGMTPWIDRTLVWHPWFDSALEGAKSIRIDQAMNGITNPYADFADIRTDSQFGRGDLTRLPTVGVVSCQQYTGAAKDGAKFLAILVTCASPHSLFSGAIVNLFGCGHATFSDGENFDIDFHTGLGYGVITVLTDTTFVWHAGQAQTGQSGVTMTNVTTGGFLTCSIGTGWTLRSCYDRANRTGADLYFNVSACATDACIDAIGDVLAANLATGRKARFECGDEWWNSFFHVYDYLRVQQFQRTGVDSTGIADSFAFFQNNLNVRMQARFAAAGRADDVVFIMPSQAANPQITESILAACAAQSCRVDEVPIAPYLANMDLNPTMPQSLAGSLPVGIQEDISDLWTDSNTQTSVSLHAAIIAASAYPDAKISCYEGGWESELVGHRYQSANDNTTAYPNLYRDQHAMHRSHRKHARQLNHLQHLQDDGVVLWHRFYVLAGGSPAAYATWEYTGQPAGTGDPAEDGSDFELLAPGGPASQEGGAIRKWNSLVDASPTPALSPATATRPRGGTVTYSASNFTGSAVTLACDGSIATLSGLTATLVGAGTTNVTATGVADGSQSATATLTGQAVTVAIAPTSATVNVGSTVQLTPTVGGAVDTTVAWASPDHSKVTVNGSGLVTGVAATTSPVNVTATSIADGSIVASCPVTVTAVAPPAVGGGARLSDLLDTLRYR